MNLVIISTNIFFRGQRLAEQMQQSNPDLVDQVLRIKYNKINCYLRIIYI